MDDDTLPRGLVPPHSDEAEQGVLGALLFDNSVIEQVGSLLDAEHFYRPDYRAIYGTIASLVAAHKPADILTVCERGGHSIAEVNALFQSVYTARHAGHYAQIVLAHWRARQAMRIGMQLASAAGRTGDEFDAEAVVSAAVTALLALGEGRRNETEPQHVGQLAAGFVDYITDVYEGRVVAMSTGLQGLDDITAGGGRTGELWVFGARPSMGKTALTNTLARRMSRPDLASLFCSQEDSLNALVARHVASLGRVNLADLRNPKKAPDSMWNGLTEGVHELSAVNLYLDAQAGLTLGDVRRKVQQTKRKAKQMGSKVGLVVVDYLQLMKGDGANRNIELGAIANGMKQLAKDEDVLAFLLSQMNREADKRLGPPMVADLRDSGDIEGAADVIGLLWRPYAYWKVDSLKRYAELVIAKQKNGQQGSVHLDFDGAYQRFSDWDGKPPSWQDAKSNRRVSTASSGGMD